MVWTRPLEVFFIELIIFLLLWLVDDYLATILSLTFSGICLGVLIIAGFAELIERSKVPRWYYYVMLVSIIAPLLSGAIYVGLMGGNLFWLEQ